MVRGTTRCRGCGILHQDDSLLPERKWHGNVCSICHCLNCSRKDGYKGQAPLRDSRIHPEFCAASRERRRLAGLRAGPPSASRESFLGPGISDFSACFYDVDLITLTTHQLYMYHYELTSRLRILATELRRRAEARLVIVSVTPSCLFVLL